MLILLLLTLLISNAVTLRQDKSILFARIVMKGLSFVVLIIWGNLCFKALEKGIGIYGGLFYTTNFTQAFSIFILLMSIIILTLNSFYPRKIIIPDVASASINKWKIHNKQNILNKIGGQFSIIEYPLIIVFIISGGLFLISTGDLISIFLSIELQSYGLYILSTLYRDSESSTASGLTYFLLGGLSSCFILLGSALLYANSGTTNLDNIYIVTSLSDLSINNELTLNMEDWYKPYYLYISLIIMFVGFLFKVSAAPFHFWSPDVYDGVPTIVTTYIAIIAKISLFAFFMELVYYTHYNIWEFSWINILLFSSMFSFIIGSILGLTQFRIKRLLAYSTISHVGFILLALSINTTESIQSYIFYILQYSLSNLNIFMILMAIGFSLYTYVYKSQESIDHIRQREEVDLNYSKIMTDQSNSPIQLTSQIKGYFDLNPFISVSLAITLFSFTGIPPIIGFFGKQMVLSAALDNGYIFMSIVAILTSVIGAGYYLNLVKEVFFYQSNYDKNHLTKFKTSFPSSNSEQVSNISSEIKLEDQVVLSSSLTSVISIITWLLLWFIFVPGEWFNIVSILTLVLFKS